MILQGDVLEQLATLADDSVHCVVTSPPYWGLRDYGVDGQLGLEPTPEEYIDKMVAVFREVRRVLRKDGTLWLNMGDSYARQAGDDSKKETDSGMKTGRTGRSSQLFKSGNNTAPAGLKPKDLIGMPWRLALALQADGWWLRCDIIWAKPNPMPESVTDRPTKAHEYVFLLTRSQRYFYDQEAVREPVTGNAHARSVAASQYPSSTIRDDNRRRNDKVPKQDQLGDPRYTGFNERWRKTQRAGVTPKSAPAGSGIKSNESFNGVLTQLVHRRNLRDVWTIPTQPYPKAHFAIYPEKLAKLCILAGTSAKGCCPCGAPWERVVEKTGHVNKREPAHVPNNSPTKTDSTGWKPMTRTTGEWQVTCSCKPSEPIPCTVLDPFGGSGTTAKVAQDEGRDWIMIELNPEYIPMIEERTRHRQEVMAL